METLPSYSHACEEPLGAHAEIAAPRSRAAPRRGRGATNDGGFGGHVTAYIEARPWAPPGRAERRGAWRPCRLYGHVASIYRGAPRLRRGATNVWGLGGHFGAPISMTRGRRAPGGRCRRGGSRRRGRRRGAGSERW